MDVRPSTNPPIYGTLAATGVTINLEELVFSLVQDNLSLPDSIESTLAAFLLAAIAAGFGYVIQRFTLPRGVNIEQQ